MLTEDYITFITDCFFHSDTDFHTTVLVNNKSYYGKKTILDNSNLVNFSALALNVLKFLIAM